MSYSVTQSETTSFTVSHARHMATKVSADLKRMQRFYAEPRDESIAGFEAELIEFLKEGYLGTVTYGFRREGEWIEPTLIYTARDLYGLDAGDDDPGRVRPNANITGATFYSYLTYSASWVRASAAEKAAFGRRLPFQRNGAPEPGVNGYLCQDRTYSAGGRTLTRSSVRSFA